MPAVASPPAVSRSTTTTLAPLLPKASAVARPMPLPAPVISATLPVKSSSMGSPFHTLVHPRESGGPGHPYESRLLDSRFRGDDDVYFLPISRAQAAKFAIRS